MKSNLPDYGLTYKRSQHVLRNLGDYPMPGTDTSPNLVSEYWDFLLTRADMAQVYVTGTTISDLVTKNINLHVDNEFNTRFDVY